MLYLTKTTVYVLLMIKRCFKQVEQYSNKSEIRILIFLFHMRQIILSIIQHCLMKPNESTINLNCLPNLSVCIH